MSSAAPWNVEAVIATIPGGPPETDSSSPVPFFHMLERLKTTKREGWRRFGIAQYVPSVLLCPMSWLTFVERRIDSRPHVPHVTNLHVRSSFPCLETQHPPLLEDGACTRHGRGAGWGHHARRRSSKDGEESPGEHDHGLLH